MRKLLADALALVLASSPFHARLLSSGTVRDADGTQKVGDAEVKENKEVSSSLVTRCETKVGVVKLVHPCASALHSHTQTQTDRQRQTQTYGQTKERQKQDKTDEGKTKTRQDRRRKEAKQKADKTDTTDRKRETKECFQGERDRQCQSAYRMFGWCAWFSGEARGQ